MHETAYNGDGKHENLTSKIVDAGEPTPTKKNQATRKTRQSLDRLVDKANFEL